MPTKITPGKAEVLPAGDSQLPSGGNDFTLSKYVSVDELRVAAKRELANRQNAHRYLKDPFLFAKYVFADEENRDLLSTLHAEGLKFITKPRPRKMILWPRSHLKSTIFTMGEALRRCLIWPNIRIMISCQKLENAKTYLLGIKKVMSDPAFIELYGNLIPPSTEKSFKNNDVQLSIFHPKKSKAKEATFTCSGPDVEKTGQHYDLIIHDDIVGRETITNNQQIEKTYQYYKDCVWLLDPPKPNRVKPEIWVIGTRWHPLDLYGWIINGATDPRCRERRFVGHASRCMCKWEVSLRSVKEGDTYIWPEVFNEQHLNDLIVADGLDHYSVACQFYNNPSDPSACWFKPVDIEAAKCTPDVITELDNAGRLVWYVAVDPAESTSSQACLTAAVAVGIDQQTGEWYVDWADGRRVETPGFLDLAMEAYRRYSGRRCPLAQFGLETHTKKALAYDLKQRMLQTNTLFTITELKPNKVGDAQRTKEMRIKRLMPLFEFKRIHINKYLKDLLDEIYTLPSASHWDLTDALSYVMDMIPEGMGYGGAIRLPKRRIGWRAIGY